MRARVRYARRAIADLIGIADYIRERNPRAAETVADRIRASIARLGMFPFIGRPTDDPSLRILPIGRYPYVVYYEVIEGDVVVHHIRHGRRKPPRPDEIRSK
jgi:addiction module RelE/StbE family toxin